MAPKTMDELILPVLSLLIEIMQNAQMRYARIGEASVSPGSGQSIPLQGRPSRARASVESPTVKPALSKSQRKGS